MPKRRPAARKSFARRRVRKYSDKMHAFPFALRFKKQLPRMEELWEEKVVPEVECEEPTMAELEHKGVPTEEWPFYIGYMKAMLSLYRKFTVATLQSEKTSLIAEYVLRGYNREVLEQVQEVAALCAEGIFEMDLWDNDFYKLIQWQHELGFEWATGGTGFYDVAEGNVLLSTGANVGSHAEMIHGVEIYRLSVCYFFTWEKERRIRTCMYFSDNSDQIIYVTMGGRVPATERYVGFKIVDNEVFGCVGNGTAETLTPALTTINPDDQLELEARFRPGQDARFYINGSLLGTLTSGLPSGCSLAENMAHVYITNTAAGEKQVIWDLWEFYQRR